MVKLLLQELVQLMIHSDLYTSMIQIYYLFHYWHKQFHIQLELMNFHME